MSANIVIYNENNNFVKGLSSILSDADYGVTVARDFEHLMKVVEYGNIQMVLTDIAFEKKDLAEGLEQIRKIRYTSNVPLMILSNISDENTKILALNAGADDYCSTQCSPLELLARVKSHLRRFLSLVKICDNIEHIYKVDDLEIDDNTRRVLVGKREVRLTPIEYKILRLLVIEKGRVLSIEQIYRSIWKMQPLGAENTIAVHIRHIREKIEVNPKEPRYLKVVWGNGYMVG